MGVWSKPTDWDAMTNDELYASVQMSRARDKKIQKAQKIVAKTSKCLGATQQGLEVATKVGFFDKLKKLFSHESDHNET